MVIPIFFMILCIGLLIFSFIQQPKECGIGLVISIIGVPVYYLLIANQDKHPEYLKKFMSKYITSFPSADGPPRTSAQNWVGTLKKIFRGFNETRPAFISSIA